MVLCVRGPQWDQTGTGGAGSLGPGRLSAAAGIDREVPALVAPLSWRELSPSWAVLTHQLPAPSEVPQTLHLNQWLTRSFSSAHFWLSFSCSFCFWILWVDLLASWTGQPLPLH